MYYNKLYLAAEVGHGHACPRLDILERNVLHPGAAILAESWLRLRLRLDGGAAGVDFQLREASLERVSDGVNENGAVRATSLLRQRLSTTPGLISGMSARHIAGEQDAPTELLPVSWFVAP